MTALFWGLLALRWLLHLLLTGRSAFRAPRDWLSHTLLGAYLALGIPAYLVGAPSWAAIALLAGGALVRSSGLSTMRGAFNYSVDQGRDEFVSSGLYRRHRNPLILGYWAELAAFALTLPLAPPAQLLIVLLGGILCAWHAHEDNNRFAERSPQYAQYLRRTGNALLNLVFPERAHLPIGRHWRLDLSSLYLAAGVFAGLLTMLVYGLPHVVLGLATGQTISALGLLPQGRDPGPTSSTHHPYFIAYRAPHQAVNRQGEREQIYAPPAAVVEILGLGAVALGIHLVPTVALPLYLVGNGALELALKFSYKNRTWIWPALFLAAGLFAALYNPSSAPASWIWPAPGEWAILSIVALVLGLGRGLRRLPISPPADG